MRPVPVPDNPPPSKEEDAYKYKYPRVRYVGEGFLVSEQLKSKTQQPTPNHSVLQNLYCLLSHLCVTQSCLVLHPRDLSQSAAHRTCKWDSKPPTKPFHYVLDMHVWYRAGTSSTVELCNRFPWATSVGKLASKKQELEIVGHRHAEGSSETGPDLWLIGYEFMHLCTCTVGSHCHIPDAWFSAKEALKWRKPVHTYSISSLPSMSTCCPVAGPPRGSLSSGTCTCLYSCQGM